MASDTVVTEIEITNRAESVNESGNGGAAAAAAASAPSATNGQEGAPGDGETTERGKMDNEGQSSTLQLGNFKVLYLVTQLTGITLIILVGSWIGIHLGGLGTSSNPGLEFNWHPLLMTIGMIFLYGNSIMIYRGLRQTRKKTLKITHASIHAVAFILVVAGLQTVFDSHNLAAKPIPNMYSLHSWVGLTAVIVFAAQYVAGFIAFLYPGIKDQYRIALMPLHVYFGLFGFVMAVAAALMGITEKLIFTLNFNPALENYSDLPNLAVIGNVIGALLVVFASLVLYLVTEPSYKRRPIPEDAVLLTGANE